MLASDSMFRARTVNRLLSSSVIHDLDTEFVFLLRNFNPMSYNSLLKSEFLDLLKQIDTGVVIYEPFPRTAEGVSEFQDTVHRLREMERLGLVGRLFVQTRMNRETEIVDMVMVQGGLTREGKRLLDEQGDIPK